jgi:hypothetical protein
MFQVIGWSNTELFLALRQTTRAIRGLRANLIELSPAFLGILDRRQLGLPLRGLGAKFVVRERLELFVQLVDTTDRRQHPLDLALILRAEYFL